MNYSNYIVQKPGRPSYIQLNCSQTALLFQDIGWFIVKSMDYLFSIVFSHEEISRQIQITCTVCSCTIDMENSAMWYKFNYIIYEQSLEGRSLWEVNSISGCSWIWRNIMKYKNLTQPFIGISTSNGSQTSFWFDS